MGKLSRAAATSWRLFRSMLSDTQPRDRASNDLSTASPYSTFTEYAPAFTSWGGSLYEKDLTRACVERFAVAASKLKPECLEPDGGSPKPRVKRLFGTDPNSAMTWPVFIRLVATRLMADTTAYIIPSLDERLSVTGLWPLRPVVAELMDYQGQPWFRFTLADGSTLAIEQSRVCVLTRFQYESDTFGGGNKAFDKTLSLIDAQQQGEERAIKTSANIRFIGKVSALVHDDALKKKRDEFSEANLTEKNQSGLLIYDATFQDLKQIDSSQYVVPADEMERIQQSVYSYFGINEKILTNQFDEDVWSAFYEGSVEPFAIQLSEGLTKMLFTPVERQHGNRVMFSANHLEYSSNASKRNMVRDMTDRAIMTINEGREVLQLPPVPGGDVFVLRGEYVIMATPNGGTAQGPANLVGSKAIPVSKNADKDFDLGGDDDIYNDTDAGGTLEQDD